LTSVLGLAPDAFNGCLRVVRPVLPQSVEQLQFRRIKIGKGSADLHFRNAGSGTVEVDATGNVQVEVDQELRSKAA